MSLRSFIRFAEAKRVRFVTTKLALQWATQPPNAKRVQSGSRLATVRRFAEYLSTVDPRTEVPSPKLLPYHIRRRPPKLYRNEDVRRLVDVAYQIAPANPIKGPTLGTLLGLLATTGMRVSEALNLDCARVQRQSAHHRKLSGYVPPPDWLCPSAHKWSLGRGSSRAGIPSGANWVAQCPLLAIGVQVNTCLLFSYFLLLLIMFGTYPAEESPIPLPFLFY